MPQLPKLLQDANVLTVDSAAYAEGGFNAQRLSLFSIQMVDNAAQDVTEAAGHDFSVYSRLEGTHVLSIFPLGNGMEYARMTCFAVREPVSPCERPFCATRDRVKGSLRIIFPPEQVQLILGDLDSDKLAQLAITEADARSIGFVV